MHNLTTAKDKFAHIEQWLKTELSSVRTGQANPGILDGITIMAYGSPMHLNQVANVVLDGNTAIRVTPWDASQVKDIEAAITAADLGLSIRGDGTSVRVSFPLLTTERREQLAKLAGERVEEARISVRKERERVIKEIDAAEKDGTLNEDAARRSRTELQKLVDASNAKFEDMRKKKEAEIAG